MSSYFYIQSQKDLDGLTREMQSAKRVALDTEADSLHNYYEKVCLIQVSFSGKNAIIDPLVKMDLTAFLEAMASKPLVLHAADYDFRMLFASYKFRPKNEVFDTMIASQMLGFEAIGLAALVERFFGIVLSKKGQKSDWSQRPLTEEQLRYAADDTRYLEEIADKLEAEIRQLGRWKWFRESCERMILTTAKESTRDPNEAWRIKGSGALPRRQLCFLRKLWHWRELESQRVDRPPFKMMTNDLLLDIVAWAVDQPPEKLEAIASEKKLPRDYDANRLAGLKEALRQAYAEQECDWPEKPKVERRFVYRCPELVENLRAECAKIAAEMKIPPHVLANRTALETLAEKKPATIEALMECANLMAWQAEIIFPVLSALLVRKTDAQADNHKP